MTADNSRVPRLWTVAAIYAALTILLTYPLSVQPATTVAWSDADTDLFMWTLAWDTHAFTSQPLAVFDANIYHPYRRTLAYSENLIGSAFFAAPVLWLTGNPVLALNVVALTSVVLCGLGGYVLAYRLGTSAGGAFICGLVFAFAPARFFRITQIHLTTVQWIPFALASLHAYLDRGRPRDLRAAVLFFSLQTLASGHGAVFLVVAIAALVVYRVALGAPVAAARRIRDLGWQGAALLAPSVLILLPYRAVQIEMGLRRTLGDTAPAPQSFLASPTHFQTFLLSFVPGAQVMERASALLFPGFLTVLLAALVFVRDRSSMRREWIFYVLLTVVSVLLAAGPLWPYVYWLPGFNFIRGPSRFMILAMVGLSVLAAMGFERLQSMVSPRRRVVVLGIVSTLLVGEFIAIPFRTVPYAVSLPAADRWLNGQPKPFVVAEVPVQPLDRYQTAYMLHSTAHWQKTVHGYSGMRPPLHEKLYSQMRRFPDDESIRALAELGVTYVVVHISEYHEAGEWEDVERRFSGYGNRLTMEFQDRTARVYRLVR
ncbi:MAG TPA: hypothetical protein VH740_19455 [Vicinamibacterales bacterium]